MYCELPELSMVRDYIEYVFVMINCMGHKLIVGVIYWQPNSGISDLKYPTSFHTEDFFLKTWLFTSLEPAYETGVKKINGLL